MAKEVLIILTHIFSKRVEVVAFILVVITALSILSLSAMGSIKSIYRIYDVFYPINNSNRFTIIITSDAISPFTSIVDLKYIEDKLKGFENISIRTGFVTIGFIGLEPVVVYEIKDINDTCSYVGQELLKRIEMLLGSYIAIHSIFTKETLILKICGIGEKPGVGVSYNTIIKIRGVPPNYYSFILIEVNNASILNKIYEALALKVEEKDVGKLIRRAILIAIRGSKDIELKEFSNPTEVYLAKFGLYRDYVIYLAYSLALTSLIGLPLLGMGTVSYLRKDLDLFLSLGVSRKSLLTTFIAFLVVLVLISNIVSMIVIMRLGIKSIIGFLGYRIPLSIDNIDIIYIGFIQLAMCITGIAIELKYYEE